MAVKLGLVFLATFVIFQMLTWESQAVVVRRDAPTTEKSASQTVDEAIQSFKSGLDDLVKKVQENELFQNVSQALQQFGETVQQQGQQLVEKIQGEVKKPNN